VGVSVSKDNAGRLTIAFKYGPFFVEKVKTIRGHKWNQEIKYRKIKNNKKSFIQAVQPIGDKECCLGLSFLKGKT
jgi:hypothetical protein